MYYNQLGHFRQCLMAHKKSKAREWMKTELKVQAWVWGVCILLSLVYYFNS